MKKDQISGKLPFILTIISGLLLYSCQKVIFPDPDTFPLGIVGSWVETSTKSDTIIFWSGNDTGIVFLQRGFEIRDGFNLPVTGSTVYSYEIFADSIHMIDGLSSAVEGGTYYFRFDEPNRTISNRKVFKIY